MAVSARILFDTPKRELATALCQLYAKCASARLVVGFMTVEGVAAITEVIRADPGKLQSLVVGAATWRAFDAFEELLTLGVPPDRLRVHLGHSRATTSGAAKHPFFRYHPMLHSKLYAFDMPKSQSALVVGSHNLTGFALNGLNGEASVLLEGASTETVFTDAKAHADAAMAEAVPYDSALRDAYAWWAGQFVEGLADKFDDTPRDGEGKRTIIILASADDFPARDDVIYLELPAALGKVQSLRAEVHLYLFDKLAATPDAALASIPSAKKSYWCRTVGIEDDRGGRELQAQWRVEIAPRPRLSRVPRPFRPTPAPEMQQVRVKAYGDVLGDFEYLFDPPRRGFDPVFDEEDIVQVSEERREELSKLELIPPEHLPFFRVVGLKPREPAEKDKLAEAMSAMSPASGAYLLMSARRRRK